MGILAIAMIFGACAAAVALTAGQSFLMALAIYSGSGILSVGMLVAIYMVSDAVRPKKAPPLLQVDMAV